MSNNPYSAPKSTPPHETSRRIRPLWRWCIAVVSLVGMALMFVDYQIARSINGYYFNNPRVPFRALDVLSALLVAYLFLVAIFGRWRLLARSS